MSSCSAMSWRAAVEAEARFTDCVTAIPGEELVPLLVEALGSLTSRRMALRILFGAAASLTSEVLPALEPLLLVSHTYLFHCRDLVRRLPREDQHRFLSDLTEKVIADPDSDYEAYRRLAEFLKEVRMWEVLEVLNNAARASEDPDIREVGMDFEVPAPHGTVPPPDYHGPGGSAHDYPTPRHKNDGRA